MLLSIAQITAYLSRISLPSQIVAHLRLGPTSIHALSAITTLQQHHMSKIPYENLEIHYGTHHTLPMSLDEIFDNVVVKGRGGICLQVHQLFVELLRNFGFSAYVTGGRVNMATDRMADATGAGERVSYGTWADMVTIVQIGSQSYCVDVSARQLSSTVPVPLIHDSPIIHMAGAQTRMLYTHLPTSGSQCLGQKYWRKQLRSSSISPWTDVYAFQETEWQTLDFHVILSGLKSLGVSWHEMCVVCHKIILEDSTPVGWLMIWHDELRQWYKGKSEVLQRFYSEDERAKALEEQFGIVLNEEERGCIKGMMSEIKDDFDFYGT